LRAISTSVAVPVAAGVGILVLTAVAGAAAAGAGRAAAGCILLEARGINKATTATRVRTVKGLALTGETSFLR
jgi:hypothetical protein